MDEKHLSKIVAETVAASVQTALENHQFGGCCSSQCTEKCGFSPSEHAIKHQKADELVLTVDNAGKSMKATIAKTVTIFLIGAIGFGTALIVLEFVQKIPRIIGKG